MISPNAHAKAQRREGPCGRPPKKTFAALRLCVIFSLLLFAVGASAQTNTFSDAEIQGRQLAQQLCETRPTENFTNSGVLYVKNKNGKQFSVPTQIQTEITLSNWFTVYIAEPNYYYEAHSQPITNKTDKWFYAVRVTHQKATYECKATFLALNSSFYEGLGTYIGSITAKTNLQTVSSRALMTSFAGSDFSLADLGLEFFHWPQQKVLPKSTNLKRGRDYTLLESTNPNPPTNGYSRVLSWIDRETGGILEAEAYDANGKLLKEFAPKSFKKVNGQWELQEMEIRNVQTGSRTRLEFDLKSN